MQIYCLLNTNITFGVYKGKELLKSFRITTKLPRTSDEFGIAIMELLRINGISIKEIVPIIKLVQL